jgi:hypothetical protein
VLECAPEERPNANSFPMLHCGTMRPFLLIGLGILVSVAPGCDTSERITRLEKQNQELQEKLKKENTVAEYDLQSKCSKDAKVWFNENSSRDKDTLLLTFTNHYNKKQNKCFILVEYHYNSKFAAPGESSWSNLMTLWDIYENSKYGDFAENHYTYYKPKVSFQDEVITCEVLSQKCKTGEEFNNAVRPFLND